MSESPNGNRTALIWGRRVINFTTSNELMLAVTAVLIVIISAIFFVIGQSFNGTATALNQTTAFIVLSMGFWAGYARVNGSRPETFRLLPRERWFFQQTIDILMVALVVTLVTSFSLFLGIAIRSNLAWWSYIILGLSLFGQTLGWAMLGLSSAIAIKIVTKHYLARATIVISLVFVVFWLINLGSALWSTQTQVWLFGDLNGVFLVGFISLGLLGIGWTVAQLILPHYHISTHKDRHYWQLRFFTQRINLFGTDIAIFIAQLLYFARSARLQRRLIAVVAVGVIGLGLQRFWILLGYPSPLFSLGLLAGLIIWLGFIFGFSSGEMSQKRVSQYQVLPIISQKITAGYLVASLVATLVLTAIFIELFSAGLLSVSQIVTIYTLAIVSHWSAFSFGQITSRLNQFESDHAVTPLLILLIVANLLIILSFNTLLSPVWQIILLVVWTVMITGLALSLSRRAET